MSFWAKTKIELKNVHALEAACQKMGLTLIVGGNYGRQTAYTIQGRGRTLGRVDRTEKEGVYSLSMETDYNHIMGHHYNKFTRQYSEEVIRAEADRNGYTIESREELPNGEVLYEICVNG